MLSAKTIKNVINEQKDVDNQLTSLIDDLYSYFKYQFKQAGCKVFVSGNKNREIYAEFSLFYPEFSSLSSAERKNVGLKYAKKLCKQLKKTEIFHYASSDFLTICISFLTKSVADEANFNDNNNVLDVVIGTEGTDVPDALVGGIYFAMGLSYEDNIIKHFKTSVSPKSYDMVFQEIKKIIELTARAIRVTEVN